MPPAYYQLYYHYYFRNLDAAKDYLEKYIALSDHKVESDYDYTDILYLTKNNRKAIDWPKNLLTVIKKRRCPHIYIDSI